MHQEINIEIIPVEEKNPMDEKLLQIMQNAKGQQLKQFIITEINNSRIKKYPTAQQILEDLR